MTFAPRRYSAPAVEEKTPNRRITPKRTMYLAMAHSNRAGKTHRVKHLSITTAGDAAKSDALTPAGPKGGVPGCHRQVML